MNDKEQIVDGPKIFACIFIFFGAIWLIVNAKALFLNWFFNVCLVLVVMLILAPKTLFGMEDNDE